MKGRRSNAACQHLKRWIDCIEPLPDTDVLFNLYDSTQILDMSSQSTFDFSSLSDVERSLVNITLKLKALLDDMPASHTQKFGGWNETFFDVLKSAVSTFRANPTARMPSVLYAIFQATMNQTIFKYADYQQSLENVEAKVAKTEGAPVFIDLPNEPLHLGAPAGNSPEVDPLMRSTSAPRQEPEQPTTSSNELAGDPATAVVKKSGITPRRSTSAPSQESGQPVGTTREEVETAPQGKVVKLSAPQLGAELSRMEAIPPPNFSRLSTSAINVSSKEKLTAEEMNILGAPLFKSRVQCSNCKLVEKPCVFALAQSVVCVLCHTKKNSCSLAPIRSSRQTVLGTQVTRLLMRWHIEKGQEAERLGVDFLSDLTPLVVPDNVGRAHPGGKRNADGKGSATQDADKRSAKGKSQGLEDEDHEMAGEMEEGGHGKEGEDTRLHERSRSVRFESQGALDVDHEMTEASAIKPSASLRRSGRASRGTKTTGEVVPLVERARKDPPATPAPAVAAIAAPAAAAAAASNAAATLAPSPATAKGRRNKKKSQPSPPISHDRATYERIPSVSDEIPPTISSPAQPRERRASPSRERSPGPSSVRVSVPLSNVGPPRHKKRAANTVETPSVARPAAASLAHAATKSAHGATAVPSSHAGTSAPGSSSLPAGPIAGVENSRALWTSWAEMATIQRQTDLMSVYESVIQQQAEDHATAMAEVEVQLRDFRRPRTTAQTQTEDEEDEEDMDMTE
ncbi:hypothetical protein BXZ70DRAFT_908219 [Cristinia sonorae]|uniref:Uncharacterized protein n=1 Tax=Cristinia sonorae TaxID=1940300 RepID=A0A8K0UMT9_9AGAR|nr:hypothetical protein BXZ70DRAFT_908219 [Cristinia sonorae]